MAGEILGVENVPWTLVSARIGGNTLDLSSYEPFKFIFGDTLIYGDDGCNSYSGLVGVTGEFIVVHLVRLTELACNGVTTFDPPTLEGRWRFQITATSFTMEKGDTVLFFATRFSNPVLSSAFVDKKWSLEYSNDTGFATLHKHGFVLTLKMTQRREFSIDYYVPPMVGIHPNNSEGGAFGIGDRGAINFYVSNFSYQSADMDLWDDWGFVRDMTESDYFQFTGGGFTLWRGSAGVRYEFSLDQR